jgi:hypothetical protein
VCKQSVDEENAVEHLLEFDEERLVLGCAVLGVLHERLKSRHDDVQFLPTTTNTRAQLGKKRAAESQHGKAGFPTHTPNHKYLTRLLQQVGLRFPGKLIQQVLHLYEVV